MAPVRGRVVAEDGDALTVVDAGLPGHWEQLVEGIEALGHRLTDVEAVLVTHGYLDEPVYRPERSESDARAGPPVARPG